MPFERRVRDVAVGPLDHHVLAGNRRSRRCGRHDRRRGPIAGQVEAGDDARLRFGGCRRRRILHVNRVEDAVARVVGIENDVDEASGEVALERVLLKQARPAGEPVEIQIRREAPGLLVEDVKRPVEVVDEEPAAARLVAHEVDPRKLSSRVVALGVRRDRHLDVVRELERGRRCLLGGNRSSHHQRRDRGADESPHSPVLQVHSHPDVLRSKRAISRRRKTAHGQHEARDDEESMHDRRSGSDLGERHPCGSRLAAVAGARSHAAVEGDRAAEGMAGVGTGDRLDRERARGRIWIDGRCRRPRVRPGHARAQQRRHRAQSGGRQGSLVEGARDARERTIADPGPRGTPTVDGDRLYVLTENGDLACLKIDGSAVWQRNMLRISADGSCGG